MFSCMLLKHLEDIRKKSPEARKRYAMLFSVIITGLIVLVWGTTLLLKSIGTGEFALKNEEENKKENLADQFRSANKFLENNAPVTTIQQQQNNWMVTEFDQYEEDEYQSGTTTPSVVPYTPSVQ